MSLTPTVAKTAFDAQLVYFVGRAKRSAVQSVIAAAVCALGASALVRFLEDKFNGEWKRIVIDAATSMNQNRSQQQPSTLIICDLVLQADMQSRNATGSVPGTTFGEILLADYMELVGVRRGNVAVSSVLWIAVMPFVADLITYALFAGIDIATADLYKSAISSAPLRNCITALASSNSPVTALSGSSVVSPSFNTIVEFENATILWWFPRAGRVWSFFCQNQQPSLKLSKENAPLLETSVYISSSSSPADRNASLVDNLIVHATWQCSLWLSYAVHRLVCGRRESKTWAAEFKNSAVRSAMRFAVLFGTSVVLSKLTRWQPYTCVLTSHVLSYVVTQAGSYTI